MRHGLAAAFTAIALAGAASAQQAASKVEPLTVADPGLTPQDQPAPEAAQPAAPPRPLAEGVVAIVNDEIISSYDLRQRLMLLILSSGMQPTQENMPALQQQALRSLVDERLQMQELKRFDAKVEDAQVDQDIEQIAKENNSDRATMLAQLAQAGIDPQTFRDQRRAAIGWQMLVSGRFGSRARVGEDQVSRTIERVAAASAKPQYLVGEIFLDASANGGPDAALANANQLVDQIVKGAPFQAVARQFSNAPSGPSGGDAGWVMAGETDPEIQAALDQMNAGQLSRPIPTKDGVWIVYLREKRAGGGAQMVSLKQAAVRLPSSATPDDVAAAQRKLTALQPKLTCDNIDKVAGSADGVVASDLGESKVDELAPEFRAFAEGAAKGQVSAPIRTGVGMHLVAVCGKHLEGAETPTREQVENRLYVQQISMLARRYLRDLRTQATIDVR